MPVHAVPDYNDFTLNSSGIIDISLTGISKFATRSVADIDNSAPAWVSGSLDRHWLSKFAETTDDPKLEVTYTLLSKGYSYFM